MRSPATTRALLLLLAAAVMSHPSIMSRAGEVTDPQPVVHGLPAPRTVHPREPRPGPPQPALRFLEPAALNPAAPEVAALAVPDPVGHFLVPYIQTSPDLNYKLAVENLPAGGAVRVLLDAGTPGQVQQWLPGPAYAGTFGGIAPGEHTLTAELFGPDRWAGPRLTARLNQVARGDIVAALGDSTTEGLQGTSLGRIGDWTRARQVVPGLVSADGRNYPQLPPGPGGLARASYTVELGRRLAAAWHHPVLVLNEGWSGATSGSYAKALLSSQFATVFGATHPTAWLVNLGVNDPLEHHDPGQLAAGLGSVVALLRQKYGAPPASIHLACPTYAKQDTRNAAEVSYMPVINQMRAAQGLGPAPNLFQYFAAHQDQIADQVHPNQGGYDAVAGLWAASLAGGTGDSC